ncbi:Peptidyl-prolyl cis-trans isomerase CWC27-like [Oopsacas minuta]|uniref:Spliceosome-associated protein CWC27 homolog n=1 Tax=Oopsacas minuta TaxID=111878 RepID=A0AAV7K2X5_9METZ|nr:Peptidyl-prolyl cis-trans isomerase CWC27-like [Oopsacas minuta]
MSSSTTDRTAHVKVPEDRHYFIVRNLIDAAQSGDDRQVTSIIRKCSNFQKQILDSRNDWGSTALHHAAEGGHLSVVKILVCARASATILNNQGETCLHRATFAKQTAVVSFLASKCPDAIDVPSDAGATALHYASKYGYYPIARHLIKHGASLDKENNIGETPLAVADRYKHLDVFFLINKEKERRDDTGVSEINSLEKDVVEAYQKAIRYSLKPEHRFLLMIVGGHGCGKTNLKYALTGEFHLQKNNQTPPTQGIHADPSACRIKTKQYKDWISEPSPNANKNLAVQRVKLEYTDLVIRQMLNELKNKKSLIQKKKFMKSYTATHHGPPSPIPAKGVKFLDADVSLDLESEENFHPPQSLPICTDLLTDAPTTPKTIVKEQVTFSPYLKNHIIDEQILHRLHFRWANEVFQKAPYPEESEYLSLNFWDFSGDEKFRTIIPFFLSSRSGYIVTYNAAKMFQEHIEMEESGVTETEKTLVYWLSLISCMFSNSSISLDALAPAKSDIAWTPSVIIVGTHSDQLVDPHSQKLVKILIRDIVNKHRKKFSFYLCDPMYSFLLNTIEDEQFIKDIDEGTVEMEPLHFLRRDIENLAFEIPVLRQPIPLQWSQFERIIYELREQRQEINSLKSVMIYISARAQICEPMDVIPMLSYFHDIGMILFYAKHPILRQYIILEPQFLVDLVANLFNPVKSFANTTCKDAKSLLHDTGQLMYRFRRCAWLDISLTEESEQYVMEILDAMNIIAQPKSWRNIKKRSDLFYAPSLVERAPPLNFLNDLREGTSRIAPLYFMFQHEQLLRNMYTYLVCACIKEGMRDPELYSDVAYISFETFTLCIFLEKEAIGFSLIPEAIHSSATSEEEISNSPLTVNSGVEDTGLTDLNNILHDIGCSLSIPFIVKELNEKCRFVRNALENQLKQILKIWFPNLRYWLCYLNEGLDSNSSQEFVKLARGTRDLALYLTSMSNIYIHEPPTNGKVLMVTTLGELDIELWSKEAPLACRNFVQLCIDGYYTGTIFHRIVPQFMAQGGDKSGTGDEGESIYGAPFKLESHQRLRFCRRGLLATAGANRNDNTSQFFFTLGAHEHLNKQHTIFGQVTGDTKYNLLRFNDVTTDSNDRPLDPPKIIKVQILSNPFQDLEPKKQDSFISNLSNSILPKIDTRKSVKNLNLLSFGDELEDGTDADSDQMQTSEILLQPKSSHDFISEGLESYQHPSLLNSTDNITSDEVCVDETELIPNETTNNITKEKSSTNSSEKEIINGNKDNNNSVQKDKQLSKGEVKSEYELLRKELRAQSKRNKEKSEISEENNQSSEDPFIKQRIQYINKSKKFKIDRSIRQDNTLAMLTKFSNKLKMVRKLAENSSDSDKSDTEELEEDKPAADASWMCKSLNFEGENIAVVKDVNVTNEDRWDIYDPRNSMNKRRREENRDIMRKKKN